MTKSAQEPLAAASEAVPEGAEEGLSKEKFGYYGLGYAGHYGYPGHYGYAHHGYGWGYPHAYGYRGYGYGHPGYWGYGYGHGYAHPYWKTGDASGDAQQQSK